MSLCLNELHFGQEFSKCEFSIFLLNRLKFIFEIQISFIEFPHRFEDFS
jgi:hypothetical protein